MFEIRWGTPRKTVRWYAGLELPTCPLPGHGDVAHIICDGNELAVIVLLLRKGIPAPTSPIPIQTLEDLDRLNFMTWLASGAPETMKVWRETFQKEIIDGAIEPVNTLPFLKWLEQTIPETVKIWREAYNREAQKRKAQENV